jgi:acyl carrier protein
MAEYQQILSDLQERLATITEGCCEIGENTKLAEQLNLSSAQVMELVLDVEDHFDISVPVNILPEVKTVKDLAMQIEILTRGEE